VLRRWPRWLVPVAAAAAVVAMIIASLAISSAIARHNAGTGPAESSGALAKVPRYFIVVPEDGGRGGRRDRQRSRAGDRRTAQAAHGVQGGGRRR
jgi:hypothetical protein